MINNLFNETHELSLEESVTQKCYLRSVQKT